MPIHNFTLIVDGPDLQDDALIDALFEAGCDDATVGRTQGIQYLDFGREAISLVEAIRSAVADVGRVDGVHVLRIDAGAPLSMAVFGPVTGIICGRDPMLITNAATWATIPLPATDPRSRNLLWHSREGRDRSGLLTVSDQGTPYGNRPGSGVMHSTRTITWGPPSTPS